VFSGGISRASGYYQWIVITHQTLLVVLGLIFNRFNVSMLALAMRPGFTYFPHWMEVAISAALIADAMLVIWLAYRFLTHDSSRRSSGGEFTVVVWNRVIFKKKA
jgi:uncharacterized integral membrane protein